MKRRTAILTFGLILQFILEIIAKIYNIPYLYECTAIGAPTLFIICMILDVFVLGTNNWFDKKIIN